MIFRRAKVLLQAIACAIAMAGTANALTIDSTSYGIVDASYAGWTTPDIITGTHDQRTASESGVARSPFEDLPGGGAGLQFNSVRSGSVIYNLAGSLLTMVWGSPDSYNTLTFWTLPDGQGDSTSVIGTALIPPYAIGAHLVTFALDGVFQSITLASSQAAFEYAGLTATPLPPALLLFGSALAGLGWLGRRRAA